MARPRRRSLQAGVERADQARRSVFQNSERVGDDHVVAELRVRGLPERDVLSSEGSPLAAEEGGGSSSREGAPVDAPTPSSLGTSFEAGSLAGSTVGVAEPGVCVGDVPAAGPSSSIGFRLEAHDVSSASTNRVPGSARSASFITTLHLTVLLYQAICGGASASQDAA